jgi:hypothetical protein
MLAGCANLYPLTDPCQFDILQSGPGWHGIEMLFDQLKRREFIHAPAVKPSRENVVSLMEALRRSIAAERPAKSAPRRGLDKRAAVKRAARHRKAS